jgi:molybdenum cofactor cytidylyltransferase
VSFAGSDSATGIVILAAGESARMAQPKQLLPFRGRTLLRSVVETAVSACDAPIFVVIGAFADEIRPQLEGFPVTVVENPDWKGGMGSSLRTGLTALLREHPDAAAVMFLVCDQPFVSAKTLTGLLDKQRATGRAIVASEYGDTLGVPALFHRSLFSEILQLDSLDGARKVIHRHIEEATGVPFPEGVIDVDTPAEYAQLEG